MRETDIARVVVQKLEGDGFQVYQEPPVVINGQTVTPDIVCTAPFGTECWIYECKLLLTGVVVEQTTRWLGWCTGVWAAVREPRHKGSRHGACREILFARGVGLMYVTGNGNCLTQFQPRQMDVRDPMRVLDALDPAQQTGLVPAGAPGGKRVQKDKWEDVRTVLREFGGEMTIKEIAAELEWSRPRRQEFVRLALRGDLRGIRQRGHDHPGRFYYDGDKL